jgi:hypothetical protein
MTNDYAYAAESAAQADILRKYYSARYLPESCRRECSTQAEADAAAKAGDVIVWRAGKLFTRGSTTVSARGSATVIADSLAIVHAYDSVIVNAYGSAIVYAYDSATVKAGNSATVYAYDSAVVTDMKTNAALTFDRPRLVLGPLGSRNDTLGVSMPSDGSEPIVYTGCWFGRLSAFETRVNEVYPTGHHGDEYRATIAYIRAIAAIYRSQGAT